MIVGVLALQGDFQKHQSILQWLGVQSLAIRYPEQLEKCAGLIIPGGESTTLTKQINYIQMRDPLLDFAKSHSIFGTCAGMIMLANEVDDSRVESLGLLDYSILRNGWGRQVHSFITEIQLEFDENTDFRATFIRAPKIKSYQNSVRILSEYRNSPVLITNGKHLAASFHPELSTDIRIHNYFLKLIND